MSTGELFDAEPLRTNRTKPKRLKSVRFGKCPGCTAPRIGLVRLGDHLIWRQHWITTWHGTRVLCYASFIAVCTAPERVPLSVVNGPVQCPHASKEQQS